MRSLLFLSLLASCAIGCDPPSRQDVMGDRCAEVDWRTSRAGKTVDCRILICHVHGGVAPAVLWCDEIKPECGQRLDR